jgi:hypothetical protein
MPMEVVSTAGEKRIDETPGNVGSPEARLALTLLTMGRKEHGTNLKAKARRPTSHVSYLAQTRKLTPVIICSPECVERAATADS